MSSLQKQFQQMEMAVFAAGIVLVAGAAWFAFRPIEPAIPPFAMEAPSQAASKPVSLQKTLDAKTFDVPLFTNLHPGAAAGSKENLTNNGGPGTIELIAITEEKGVLVATLYHREKDQLQIVRNGEPVFGYQVKSLTKDTLELAGGAGLSLQLRKERR